jgi:tetrahydromethanopterin S-methyltransferase subunit G
MKKFAAAHLTLETCLSGKSLDVLLEEYLRKVEKQKDQLSASHQRLDKIEKKLRLANDRVELVRFSAFEDVGSELSFALAILNQEGNGVVLSSINNREETRMYAKPVAGGISNHNLSREEIEVIARAQIGEKI